MACERMRDIVPGMSGKTDKATVFEYAVHYIEFLHQLLGPAYDEVCVEKKRKNYHNYYQIAINVSSLPMKKSRLIKNVLGCKKKFSFQHFRFLQGNIFCYKVDLKLSHILVT